MLTHFGNEPDGWDIEGTQQVGIRLFGNALQVWVILQGRHPVTVKEASLAFRATSGRVREAVDEHPWMYIDGENIEHDGE